MKVQRFFPHLFPFIFEAIYLLMKKQSPGIIDAIINTLAIDINRT